MERISIQGKEVSFQRGSDDIGIVTFYADFDEAQLEALFDSFSGITVYALKIEDWNKELSPWHAPAVFGDDDFGDGAKDTLDFILDRLIPEMECDRYFIGGYSLAGLFSLWACYQSDVFYACAASSPSVWFDGWIDFIKDHEFKAKKVYLSLGEKEDRTKNQRMKKVRENMIIQNDILSEKVDCQLEWNKGGHFENVNERKVRSFLSLF